MVKCPFCHASYVLNTIFCNECGNYLLDDDTPPTDPLNLTEAGWVGKAGPAGNSTSPAAFQPEMISQGVRLKIGPDRREVEVALDRAIHLGRMDPASTVFPEIDLSNDGDLAQSVSRRHARILKRGNSIIIEDLGSINGTFINGERLSPYLPEPLQDGDTLQLGRLLIKVTIQAH